MITLTIDGKKVEVEEGTTILQAAEKLDIKIPTLCHHKSDALRRLPGMSGRGRQRGALFMDSGIMCLPSCGGSDRLYQFGKGTENPQDRPRAAAGPVSRFAGYH